jgi:hypothetical protein
VVFYPSELSHSILTRRVGARYYDAQVGRFVTRDTDIREHPYLYCKHNPINSVDPSGHFGVPALIGAVIGAVLIGGWIAFTGGTGVVVLIAAGLGGAGGGVIGGQFDPPGARTPPITNALEGGIIGLMIGGFLWGGGPQPPGPNPNPINWMSEWFGKLRPMPN